MFRRKPAFTSIALASIIAAFILPISKAHAATIAMNASDAINTSSFNSGLHWIGGTAPASGNTYQTAAFLLRTPQNGTAITFQGSVLEVQAGGSLRDKTAATVAITNLILDDTAVLELTQPNGVNNTTATGTLAGNITLASGTAIIHSGISSDVAGENFFITANIGGAGGISTAGSTGNIFLMGTNIFTGSTMVSAGTLGGAGVISSPVSVAAGGTLSPGGSTNRTLTISNALTLNGTVSLKINKTGAVLTSDLIRGVTTLGYGGSLLVTATGDSLNAGDAFQLFSAAAFSGSFANIALPALTNGLAWDTSGLSNGIITVVTGATATVLYLDPSLPPDMRATNLIAQMTLQEKATQLFHSGSVNARLGIPNYGGWNQCLHGVSYSKPTTLFPVSIAAAATWNPALIRTEADAIADEARAYNKTDGKGLIYRAPVINISRNPFWGRIQECYGEDPWLTSRMGVSYLQGLQGTNSKYLKLAGTLKHFAVNNVEANRTTLSASVPERWLHEFWLPHWKACATEGRAQSIMAAYNRINGIHCAVNTNLLTDILRTRWGFKGFVVSDLGGINNMINTDHIFPDAPTADAAAISAGCNYDDEQYRDGIPTAVGNGLITETAVDQSLALVLKTAFRLGVFDPPALVPYTTIDASVIHSPAHQDLALQVAQASQVLLQNQNGLLPLDKNVVTNIAVIGPLADTFVAGNYYSGTPVNPITPRQGLINRAKLGAQINYAVGCGISTAATATQLSAALQTASNAQVVVMCLGTDGSIEGEGNDREALELTDAQESLLENVYAANTNLVLVLLNAGPLAIPWAKTNVSAILESWYAGEKGGNAIADVLFGDVNPGGKLPYTVYPSSTVPGLPSQTEYDVSKGFTYMFFTNQALFPFGHGLSYTTFGYSNLVFSVQTNLPDTMLTGSVDIRNTGSRAGTEVAQIYFHNQSTNVAEAIKKLIAFKSVTLNPGESQTVNFSVSVDQLSRYDDVTAHDFIVDSGGYDLMAGSSSADIRLQTNFTLAFPAVILPGAPLGLTAAIYGTNVVLDWNKASRATSYFIRRALSTNGPFTAIAGGLTNLTFTDTNPVLNVTNFYLLTSTNSAGESVGTMVAIFVSPYIAPAGAPTGLNISANGSLVNLNWTGSTNTASYIVRRGIKSSGADLAIVASGIATTSYAETLTNSSCTYFYQVTATNAGGESLPASGSVKLSQPPPFPWLETDVGVVGLPGGASVNSNAFTIQGAGATIYNAADGFHFVYMPLKYDCTLIARVVDTMPTSDQSDGWDKAGVMVRESLTPDSKYAMAMMTSGQGSAFQYRATTGGGTTRAQNTTRNCPYWVKLVRAGTVLSAYDSSDGVTWSPIGTSATFTMSTNVFAGLAVSARNTNLLDTASFDNLALLVEINDAIPSAWRQQHFGNLTDTNGQSCATCDPDGDHFSNLAEYISGTDPLDGGSYFKISDVRPSGTNFVVRFNSISNRNYGMDRALDLTASQWQTILSNQPGTGGALELQDTNALGRSNSFYRITVGQ